ncbi:MAG: HAMP domain-containing sensor histidine kinase [Ekhidna sp.]|uniref:sensor histidine kinase n=1 Tax=Ekhidna sp. TaxID=2608089 RepID=UPI0032ECC2F4
MEKNVTENIEDIERQLQKAKAEVERASLLRDTLIRIVSHDIRGPMSNLKSVISLVREEQVGLEQAKEFMGTIDKGVDHTIQMLEELMEWGRAASANKIDQEEIALDEIINPTIDRLQSHIDRKELSLSVMGDLDTKCVFDRNALKVVMRNLISNAVKFTPKGGSVQVKVEDQGEDISISIIDTGIGISDEMKANLFEMKKDNKRPGTDNEKSSGVGLFITKDLISQNGGAIAVKDNPQGQGTIFIFTLRKA